MRRLISNFISDHAHCVSPVHKNAIICHLLDLIESPKFAEEYSRIRPHFDLGMGENINQKWSNVMTALQDAAKAFAEALQKATAGSDTTVDKAHLDTLDSEVSALTAREGTTEEKLADATAALGIITGSLTPAAATPTPTSSPDSAPDSAAASTPDSTAQSGS